MCFVLRGSSLTKTSFLSPASLRAFLKRRRPFDCDTSASVANTECETEAAARHLITLAQHVYLSRDTASLVQLIARALIQVESF